MHRVHFDAVHARFLAHFRSLCVSVDDVLDFLFRERAAGDVLRPAGRQLARRSADIGRVEDGFHQRADELVADGQRQQVAERKRTPEACGQLHEQFRPRLMDFLHIGFELSERSFRLIKPLSAYEISERRNAGNDEPDVVFRTFEEEGRGILVEMMRFHPSEQRRSAHRTKHNAVFDFHIADFPRGEQRFKLFVHNFPPYGFRRRINIPLRHSRRRQ